VKRRITGKEVTDSGKACGSMTESVFYADVLMQWLTNGRRLCQGQTFCHGPSAGVNAKQFS